MRSIEWVVAGEVDLAQLGKGQAVNSFNLRLGQAARPRFFCLLTMLASALIERGRARCRFCNLNLKRLPPPQLRMGNWS